MPLFRRQQGQQQEQHSPRGERGYGNKRCDLFEEDSVPSSGEEAVQVEIPCAAIQSMGTVPAVVSEPAVTPVVAAPAVTATLPVTAPAVATPAVAFTPPGAAAGAAVADAVTPAATAPAVAHIGQLPVVAIAPVDDVPSPTRRATISKLYARTDTKVLMPIPLRPFSTDRSVSGEGLFWSLETCFFLVFK